MVGPRFLCALSDRRRTDARAALATRFVHAVPLGAERSGLGQGGNSRPRHSLDRRLLCRRCIVMTYVLMADLVTPWVLAYSAEAVISVIALGIKVRVFITQVVACLDICACARIRSCILPCVRAFCPFVCAVRPYCPSVCLCIHPCARAMRVCALMPSKAWGLCVTAKSLATATTCCTQSLLISSWLVCIHV